MKVLIVEDHPDIVEILEICLVIRWPGTDVLAVDNGLAVARTVRFPHPDGPENSIGRSCCRAWSMRSSDLFISELAAANGP